jgi:hypothetical protein
MATARPLARWPGGDEQNEPITAEQGWVHGQRNVAWVDAHRDELEATYAGHWVCVSEQRVVAADRNRLALSAAVRAAGTERNGSYVFYVLAAGETGGIHPRFRLAAHASE